MADLIRPTEAGIPVFAVIPAKAGIQYANLAAVTQPCASACAEMTAR
jgi:hypothetical protein